jgi:hypothetical protein
MCFGVKRGPQGKSWAGLTKKGVFPSEAVQAQIYELG